MAQRKKESWTVFYLDFLKKNYKACRVSAKNKIFLKMELEMTWPEGRLCSQRQVLRSSCKEALAA